MTAPNELTFCPGCRGHYPRSTFINHKRFLSDGSDQLLCRLCTRVIHRELYRSPWKISKIIRNVFTYAAQVQGGCN